MNRYIIILSPMLLILMACTNRNQKSTPIDKGNALGIEESMLYEYAGEKAILMLSLLENDTLLPRSQETGGELRSVKASDWTSGFFPGVLWFLYEETKDEKWRHEAHTYTSYLANEQFNDRTHDMGFKMYCSYGNGYKLSSDSNYRQILIKSAYTLASRFNPAVGCIKSWDWGKDRWNFPVIIDNMMNLELLFWAFKETGDSLFLNIAVSHADKTLENHYREDFSSFHVVDYNPENGQVMKKLTHQGYSESSAWARGQAWGLYGYIVCYRETLLPQYLDAAQKIAAFLNNHPNMPADNIPYWDLNDPEIPDSPRDVSAAAVICSALYELASITNEKNAAYADWADDIFQSMMSETYSNSKNKSPFMLKHSTGNKPANDEIDLPIIYADYYFMEAAIRKNSFRK